jgi:RNA polymerase sigma-70 factor (ECF subfamily)
VLFAAYRGGDEAAFRALFDRYAPLLTRVFGRRLSGRAEVHDLVQQTFLLLHRARNDFRADGKLRPWLMTIALNTLRRHLRKTMRAREVPLEQPADEGSSAELGEPVAAHDPVVAERRRRLRAALAKLPEAQRVAIELHWLEGLPFPEVAEIVGASTSAIKVRAHRGYERLRQLLAEEDVTKPGGSDH